MSPQSPDNTNTGAVAIEDKALDKESVIELLSEDEEKQETLELEEPTKAGKKDTEPKEKEKPEKGKEKEDEEDEELTLEEELEEELKEPDEDKLELVSPPSRKEILTAFPELFKKFPHIERAIYREQKYVELLPTLDDARLAVDKATALDGYEKEIMGGSTESLLTAVKDNNKEAFAKVVDNYLPTLHKVDQHAYYHTIGNIIKHTIISMARDSKEKDDEELGNAAAILNRYMFDTDKFTNPTRLAKDDLVSDEAKSKEAEIYNREKALLERQFNSAQDSLGTRVDNILKASVDKAIDPNDSMTDYVKRNATREVLENLENLISKDTRFRNVYDRLWEKAFNSDFSKESMDNIKSAYLSKAKTLLPILIKKSRNEALKGLNRKASDDTREKDRKGPLPVGKTRSSTTLASGRATREASKSIPRGMTSLEFLNSDD